MRPPAFVVRSARSSALLDPVHSSTTSAPPSRKSWPALGRELDRAGVAADGLGRVLGPDDLVGAREFGGGALLRVLGRHDHVPGLGEELERDQRQDADGAGADQQHGVAGRDLRAGGRVHGARERLEQDGDLVRHARRARRAAGTDGPPACGPTRRRSGCSSRSAGRASGRRPRRDRSGWCRPAAQLGHGGSSPRAAQDRTLPITTRVPAGRSSQSSSSSPTISCPGTNGIETSGEK